MLAVNKHIDKAAFDELKGNKQKLNDKIDEAIKAAFKEKNSEGKTFGEIMESGKLPTEIVK